MVENSFKAYKWWTIKELTYLCYFYGKKSSIQIGLVLNRSEFSVRQKVSKLKKKGEFDFYFNLGRNEYEVSSLQRKH